MRNSKQFDEDLQLKNFESLEKDFQEAKKFYTNMKCDDVAKHYPGFCFEKSILYLKYPTYKVVFFNRKIEHREIGQMLQCEQNYEICDEPNVVSFPSMVQLKMTSIYCLCTNLTDNTEFAKRIMSTLEKAGIYSERWITSALYAFPIQVNEDDFFTIIHQQNI